MIDPEETLRGVTSSVLKHYAVFPVESTESALHRLRHEPFDLVLINLPLHQTHSFFLRLREFYKDLHCVLLISFHDLEAVVGLLKTGLCNFVLKPFTQQEMVNSVEESLKKVRLLNENVRLNLLMPLFEMTQRLSARPKPEDVCSQILNLMIRENGSDFVSFSYQNSLSHQIFKEIKTSPTGNREGFLAFVDWIEKKFSKLEHSILITEHKSENPEVADQMRSNHCSSLMIYPLISKTHLMGFLICGKVSKYHYFTGNDNELFSIVGNQIAMMLENDSLIEDLEGAHFESLKVLASAIEAKDAYTSGHCDRLVEYAIIIAEKLNLSSQERKMLKYGAALHDIGKIGIKDSILGKPGKLTPEEYEEMKRHPKIGSDILQNIKFLRPVAPIIYHHQECFDGSGYPGGLSGEEIPVGSRIVAILDTFDAMTTDRPYRKALPVQRAIDELIKYSGRQFDPHLVRAFIEVVEETGLIQ